MKAVQTHPDGHSEVVERPIPGITAGEALIRTRACGVCGTDVLKINLKLLNKPTVLGHELVGEVVAVGAGVADWKSGDLMVVAHHVPCFACHFCRHGQPSMCTDFKASNYEPGGFAEFVRIPAVHLQNTALKIPADLDLREALFTEPLGCCVRNVKRLPLMAGDVVIVIGLGSIGLMMAGLLHRQGVRVLGVDLDEARARLSVDFGVSCALSRVDDALHAAARELTDGRGADGVIFTAGPTTLLGEALRWIRDGGFVNLFSHLSGDVAMLDTSALYHRELQIITTYSSSPESLREAFAILQEKQLKPSRMISGNYGLNDLQSAVADINQRRTLKAVLTP